jgi:hypothetical protein
VTKPYALLNDKSKGTRLSLLIAIVSSLIVAFYTQTPFGHIQNALAQNNTTVINQTVGVTGNQTMANQTAGMFGNLTKTDFDSVTSLLSKVREMLTLANDTSEAYVRLDRADSALFTILNERNLQHELFQPVKDAIDNAKDALRQYDNATAIEELNSAGVALLQITQHLPPGESGSERYRFLDQLKKEAAKASG